MRVVLILIDKLHIACYEFFFMKDYEYQDLKGEDHEGNSKHTGDGHHADAGPTPDQSLKSLRTGRPCTHGPFSVTWEDIELISFDVACHYRLANPFILV